MRSMVINNKKSPTIGLGQKKESEEVVSAVAYDWSPIRMIVS